MIALKLNSKEVWTCWSAGVCVLQERWLPAVWSTGEMISDVSFRAKASKPMPSNSGGFFWCSDEAHVDNQVVVSPDQVCGFGGEGVKWERWTSAVHSNIQNAKRKDAEWHKPTILPVSRPTGNRKETRHLCVDCYIFFGKDKNVKVRVDENKEKVKK